MSDDYDLDVMDSEPMFQIADWALEKELWDGRVVTIDDATVLQEEVLERIFAELLNLPPAELERAFEQLHYWGLTRQTGVFWKEIFKS